jgi:hypothetical protein
VAKRTPTPEQQEFLEAFRRYRELRRQYIRRTQVIDGRIFLGNLGSLAAVVVMFGAPLALVLGAFGLGAGVDLAAVEGAGLLLAGFLVLAVLVGLENRRIERQGKSGQTPVKDILGGLILGLIGAGLIASQDTAAVIGWLVVMFCLVAVTKGILRLVFAGLKILFRKPTGPEELEPIEGGERPAA